MEKWSTPDERKCFLKYRKNEWCKALSYISRSQAALRGILDAFTKIYDEFRVSSDLTEMCVPNRQSRRSQVRLIDVFTALINCLTLWIQLLEIRPDGSQREMQSCQIGEDSISERVIWSHEWSKVKCMTQMASKCKRNVKFRRAHSNKWCEALSSSFFSSGGP